MDHVPEGLESPLETASDEQLWTAVEYFAATKSDYATETELRRSLSEALPPDVDLQVLLDDLRRPDNAAEAAHYVAAGLVAENDRSALAASVERSGEKLAVVETALGVLLVMYAIHYVATRGRESEETTRKNPDGSIERTVIRYQKPTPWLTTLISLFRAGTGAPDLPPSAPADRDELSPSDDEPHND